MCGGLISIISGCICLWTLVGQDPKDLKHLTARPQLFQYLYSAPSLWGGAGALASLLSVGSWVWLDLNQGLTTRIVVVLLTATLMGNAFLCFILGATTYGDRETEAV